ncbi:MarR family winged helix-turn-helix transcriptional regulator [Demequina sp. NBRC 110053]|uniref:MarR family winged helix-turn-helix transcriptional regulator n=1 Tax=Demequina sp. NBRC 110053 TaxID=1570342 RepID=UPI000A06DBA8|nr:MarR family transcriptional regulator [Demequina sp. NBRC 110053]
MTRDAMGAWRAFLEVHARLMPLIEQQLHLDGDLTHAQYGVLLALQGEPHGLTMTEIARTMVVSKSGLTYQVDRLVDSGRCTRAVDPDDERRRVVRLTRAGIEALDDVREGHLALVREHFIGPAMDSDVAAIARALAAINAHLKAADA